MSTGAEDREQVIDDLRRRLREAEETIAAIRSGEVDALVVGDDDAEAIFTIENETGYREFMEAMNPGAIAVDISGNVLYANAQITSLVHQTLDTIQGKQLAQIFNSGSSDKFRDLLSAASTGRRTESFRFHGDDGSDRHFDVSASPFRMGAVSGYAITFADVTERVRAEAAEQNERTARAVIASANEAVLVCDRTGRITHANAAARVISEAALIGNLFNEVVPLRLAGAGGLVQSDDIVSLALEGIAVQGLEVTAPAAPKIKDYLVSAAPLRVADEQINGCVITMVDLTQRKALERQQLLLMAELDHRVKNTLALVQSISSRTFTTEETLEGYHTAFSGRIQALAATHNLLADRSWTNLKLDDILMAELNPYVDRGERIATAGLDINVAPRAAIALGLIFHELVTNAVKYGALSSASGVVTVTSRPRAVGDKSLVIEWRETGGPVVQGAKRRGFGTAVINRSLQYSPNGKADLALDPKGVVCALWVPLEDVPDASGVVA